MQNKDTSFTLAQAGAINALTETEQKDGRINDTVIEAGNINFVHNKLDGFQNGIQDELENVATLDGAPLNPADPTQCATVIDARLKKDFSSLPTATSPSGADLLVVQQSGVSKSVSYTALQAGALVPLQTQIISSPVATVEFTGLDGTYKRYVIEITDMKPATDDVNAYVRVSSDNGSSYDAGATDYVWGLVPVAVGDIDSSAAEILLNSNASTSYRIGNGAGKYFNATIEIYNPSNASSFAMIGFTSHHISTNGAAQKANGTGYRATAKTIDAIQILLSSGNITSGTFKIYGVK